MFGTLDYRQFGRGPGRWSPARSPAPPADELVEVRVEGLEEPIQCTRRHPFWSEDRQAFVDAGKLEVGEQLRSRSGQAVEVASIEPIPSVDRVFNLEVHNQHVYQVTADGLLVHNNCGKGKPKVDKSRSGGKRTKPVNLPSSKKVNVDIDHIASGHMKGGSRVSPNKDLFPDSWSREQVERVVKGAYSNAKRIRSQGDRVLGRGTSHGKTIEFWVNKVTKEIETAYPIN